ncbi:type III secretion apparatus protein OrgA/MxiK [Chromobacterium amazonense]|uniref:Type III secretion apparatus protein OrgA/MxiK n=2 Tax=Chromobacterium amazonense TaxID=1382803 RepID=A0ABU8UYW2_9NEIS|nr:type III secretion apparatus protein OrgA/MxiK [Chromobacterium amazonense]MDQ4539725.1 type III secretion apparatus protein OrgA/MxiK [Chromobacterium amazonense]
MHASSLQRVLFDPLSYLHPGRLSLTASLTEPATARAAVNSLLLAVFKMEHNCDDSLLDSLARQWLRHWLRLPQTAYLIGCHFLRADLAWRAGQLALPEWAHAFSTIALPTEAAPRQAAPSHNAILRAGYARLLPWRARLPTPLAQRLPLLFPPHVDTVTAQQGADPLILTLALQHAQRHPHALPTDAD